MIPRLAASNSSPFKTCPRCGNAGSATVAGKGEMAKFKKVWCHMVSQRQSVASWSQQVCHESHIFPSPKGFQLSFTTKVRQHQNNAWSEKFHRSPTVGPTKTSETKHGASRRSQGIAAWSMKNQWLWRLWMQYQRKLQRNFEDRHIVCRAWSWIVAYW